MWRDNPREPREYSIQNVRFRIKDSESEYNFLECRILEFAHLNTNRIFCKVQVLWNTEPKTVAWFPLDLLDRIED